MPRFIRRKKRNEIIIGFTKELELGQQVNGKRGKSHWQKSDGSREDHN